MRLSAIDWWGLPSEIQNNAGNPLFKPVTISWSRPKIWPHDEPAPIEGVAEQPGYLYCLVRNHHKAIKKDEIAYIGITNNLKRRFTNHPTAEELCKLKGPTSLSIGTIDFHGYLTAMRSGNRQAIEELEHILIWAVGPSYNERKQAILPGLGKNPGRAWQITNKGYRFSGRLQQEIVYPWMLVKNGKDVSTKRKS